LSIFDAFLSKTHLSLKRQFGDNLSFGLSLKRQIFV
jgi:hypothetical protein